MRMYPIVTVPASYIEEVVPGPKLEIHRIQRVLSSAKAISRSIPYDHVAANFQRARWGGIDDAIAYYEVNVKERTRFMSSLSLAVLPRREEDTERSGHVERI